MICLQVIIVVVRQGLSGGSGQFLLVLLLLGFVQASFGGLEGWGLHKVKGSVPGELASQPQERLFEVVVGFGGNIVVLEILLSVEGDLLGLDLSVFDFDLVSSQDNGNVFAHTGEIAVPVGHIFVGDARSDIEHDDGALSLNVVSIAQSSKLFLSGSVPYIEFDGSTVGVESQRVDFDSESGDVLLFELSSEMALDKCGLSDTPVADQNELEFRNFLRL